MKVGVFIGKFIPLHRGHITTILQAYTKCDKLYVIVSERRKEDGTLCYVNNIPYIPGKMRKQWASQEFQGFDNIKIVLVDESDIPAPPDGWEEYARIIQNSVPENIDLIFGGEPEYEPYYNRYFPTAKYIILDPARSRWGVSGSLIRSDPMQYWDYIVGSARPFFAKKILITGPESCGKTTLVKALAKIYHTSWSEEVGRYYAGKYLGGDETVFTDADFKRIAHLQYEQDLEALRHANRVCFFDTDAVVTEFYSKLYIGWGNEYVRAHIDPNKYDKVLILTPEVRWVDDGMRLHGEQDERKRLYEMLYDLYIEHKFGKKIVEITGSSYSERLSKVMEEVDKTMIMRF